MNVSRDRNVVSAEPAWFPDGTRLAWTGGMTGSTDIYVGLADGTAVHNWTLIMFGGFGSPEPSPDGNEIVFTKVAGEALYRAPYTPGGYVTLGTVKNLGTGSFPSWSPDGSRISATRWSNRTVGEIDNLDLATGTRTTLRATPGFADYEGEISPDGRRIAFTSDASGSDDIWIVELDASGAFLPGSLKNLTPWAATREGAPTWSPDGRYIAFLDRTNWYLRVMGSDGSNPVSFTSLGHVYDVAWSPGAPGEKLPAPDTEPPVVGLTVTEATLWPPNHQMVDVGLGLTVVDDTDSDPVVVLTVESDEPDDAKGGGDGATTGDVELRLAGGTLTSAPGAEAVSVKGGAADLADALESLLLRAERAGNGSGRTYRITVVATDAAGNETKAVADVVVPHDKGKGKK